MLCASDEVTSPHYVDFIFKWLCLTAESLVKNYISHDSLASKWRQKLFSARPLKRRFFK